MNLCVFCWDDQHNKYNITCENNRYISYPDGEVYTSLVYIPANIIRDGLRCPDCNVRIGGYHHPGCTYEICPRCGGSLRSCGCLG